MAIRAPDGAKNSHILPTGQWYAPSAVNNDAWYWLGESQCYIMAHMLNLKKWDQQQVVMAIRAPDGAKKTAYYIFKHPEEDGS